MALQPLAEITEARDVCSAQGRPRTWEKPRLSYVGHVADILQNEGGQAKLSPSTSDPGDPRKPPGQG